MENLSGEGDAHRTLRSPSPPQKRRRSTFFERRESFVPQTENVNDNTDVTVNDKHNQDLSEYYSRLFSEKEQWKSEVKDRRNKYHDLRHQYHMAVKGPRHSKISFAALTKDDIEFLNAKPNLSNLLAGQQKLRKSAREIMAFLQRANELDDQILTYCEEKVNKINENLLNNSTIELQE